MLGKRLVIAAVLSIGGLFSADTATAAEPASLTIRALRTRIYVMRPGDAEIVQTGSLSLGESDRLIVLFLGTRVGKLTVTDADTVGDTIALNGELRTTFPSTFNETATSPDQIEQNLPVTVFGLMTADISYVNIVNGIPATYFFKLKF